LKLWNLAFNIARNRFLIAVASTPHLYTHSHYSRTGNATSRDNRAGASGNADRSDGRAGEFLNREEAVEEELSTGIKAFKTSGPRDEEDSGGFEDEGMMGHEDEYVF